MDLKEMIVLVVAVMGFFFGLYKWLIARNDKRRERINSAQDRAIEEHRNRLDRHSERLGALHEMATATRQETLKNTDRLERIEGMEARIDTKLEKVHSRLTAISRDLNQAIGVQRASYEAEITHLVERVSAALQQSGADK